MIKLSNGVELSEETVISALKAKGINVEPPKPEHEFEPGDVAYYNDHEELKYWRLIISGLKSVAHDGYITGDGTQEYFHKNNYKYIGRMSDLLKEK